MLCSCFHRCLLCFSKSSWVGQEVVCLCAFWSYPHESTWSSTPCVLLGLAPVIVCVDSNPMRCELFVSHELFQTLTNSPSYLKVLISDFGWIPNGICSPLKDTAGRGRYRKGRSRLKWTKSLNVKAVIYSASGVFKEVILQFMTIWSWVVHPCKLCYCVTFRFKTF